MASLAAGWICLFADYAQAFLPRRTVFFIEDGE
jgi:hypothetical protein